MISTLVRVQILKTLAFACLYVFSTHGWKKVSSFHQRSLFI